MTEDTKEAYHMVDVNVFQENLFHTKMNLHFVVTGKEVSEKHLARAVQLSAEKYCSVALMLDKTVEITHSHEVIDSTAK
jgi:putative redox protein